MILGKTPGIGKKFVSSAKRPDSIQLPIRWVPAVISPRLKRPVREADHSPVPSTEIKTDWIYTSNPLKAFIINTGTIFLFADSEITNSRGATCQRSNLSTIRPEQKTLKMNPGLGDEMGVECLLPRVRTDRRIRQWNMRVTSNKYCDSRSLCTQLVELV